MKSKNIFKFIFICLVLLFLALYIGESTGMYKYESNKKTTLTRKAIKKYENDLKKGKKIDVKNYLQEEKNYSNRASRMGLRISNLLESFFTKTMEYFFRQIDSEINTKKRNY